MENEDLEEKLDQREHRVQPDHLDLREDLEARV